ncbi:MAG: GAF domain-containing protein [Paludibacteraceae bacterium]|nr:GAF domain-containing protein [Paludibacteraceae bacterium]
MNKEEQYKELLPQLEAIVAGEGDEIANMANVAAMLHTTFGFWWTGFYRVSNCQPSASSNQKTNAELVLGPFQGPVACTRIPYGKGVCGTAWERGETVIVPDVHKFKGHIACSSASNSEIVVPVFKGDEVTAVLDIDSKDFGTFDEEDKYWLEKIVKQCFAQ